MEECKAASVVLGLPYGETETAGNDLVSRPAGCYWKNKKLYFNTVVDIFHTSPESFGARGGVCFKGKFGIVTKGK